MVRLCINYLSLGVVSFFVRNLPNLWRSYGKQYYLQTKDEVLKEFHTSSDGLSTKQAEENLAKYGKNALVEGKKKTTFQVFLEQFKDLMVIILIIAAVISAFYR